MLGPGRLASGCHASTRPISWSGAHALMSPCKATSEPSSSLTCSLLRPVLLWVTLEAHWLPGPVRLEEIPFVESRRGGRWRGEQLPPYFLAFPTSHHLPAERACWGQGLGARFTRSGSVTSAKEPALALASAFALPAPSSQASPHCLSSSAYTSGSAWDPETPEAPQEALREEPG